MMEGWVKHRQGSFHLDVRWSIASGQTLALLGPSGSGKTTTLRAIAGLVKPNEGRIAVEGSVLLDSARGIDLPSDKRHIGLLPQSFALFPHLTVEQNVGFGLRSLPEEKAGRRVKELLLMLHIDELKERFPHQISAGQQQRVALARALAPKPKLLLLDEPFAALDQELRRELRMELRNLRQREQVTTLLVTHDIADAVSLSDKVVVIEKGSVVAEGAPLEVLRRPGAETVSRITGVENIFEGVVLSQAPTDGTMTCDVDGLTLEIPYAPLVDGSRVRIGLRAGDIILASEKPVGLSARNTLRGVVKSVERKGFEAEAVVECGREIRVELTPRAVETLGIVPGKQVWLVVKTNSCFLIE